MTRVYLNTIKYLTAFVLSGVSGYYYAIQKYSLIVNEKPNKPVLTVAGIVHVCPSNKIALIERGKNPKGLAMFGGHVEDKESPEQAFRRELYEELKISEAKEIKLVGVHGDFGRDPRQHSVEVTYSCVTSQIPHAGSDAKSVTLYTSDEIKRELQGNLRAFAFDHGNILECYLNNLENHNPCTEMSSLKVENILCASNKTKF